MKVGDTGTTLGGMRYRVLAVDLAGGRGPVAAAIGIGDEEMLHRFQADGTNEGPGGVSLAAREGGGMIFGKAPVRRIVRSWPGEGTGETIYQDENGNTYRDVTSAEADNIRNSTAGVVYRRYPDGTIR